MDKTKTLEGAKTITGIVIAGLPQFLKLFFDIEIPAADFQLLFEQAFLLFGSCMGIYGRVVAKKPLI